MEGGGIHEPMDDDDEATIHWIESYPFAMAEWEVDLCFRYGDDKPLWFRQWLRLRTFIAERL